MHNCDREVHLQGLPHGPSSICSPYKPVPLHPLPQKETEPFKWTKAWYPVYPMHYLNPKKPEQVYLLGKKLVVWSDGKEWHCFEDMCPHRLAPLSEGRIEGNELQCAYHGWQFNSKGSCTKLPQIKDPQAHATACSSQRSCVRKFPTQVKDGLLWVWPESGPQALVASSAAQPNLQLPELANANQANPTDNTRWFMRDLPLRFETLVENVLDPSHVPFAHHGVLGKRTMVPDTAMAQTEYITHDGFSINWQQSSRTINISFVSPALVRYSFAYGTMMSFSVPTKPGWSRLLFSFVTPSGSQDKRPWWLKLAMSIASFPPVKDHIDRNKVLDGDTYMLHQAERELLSKNNDWKKHYYSPSSMDQAIVQWRKWLQAYGGEVPTMTEADNEHMPPKMSREAVLDRCSQHTKYCPTCQQAIKLIDFTTAMAAAAVAAALVVVVARQIAGQPLLQAGNLWLAAGVAAAALLVRQLQAFRKELFFTDYVHAFK